MTEKEIFKNLSENYQRNQRRLTMLSNPSIEKLNEEVDFLKNEYGKSFGKYKADDVNFNAKLDEAINQSRNALIKFINERMTKSSKRKNEKVISTLKNSSTEKKSAKKRIRITPKFNNENVGDGERGENNVNFQLSFLPYEYVIIEGNCQNKYRNDCILIKDENLVDAYQEFDHLIVGTQGVFNIETKGYKGQIVIDENGKWYTKKANSDEVKSLESPVGQVLRHSNILKSFLGEVPVIDIICMANKELIMRGENNSPIKIVQTDMLLNYIQNYENGKSFSEEVIETIADLIDSHKINRTII
jgi:hypothetical protein